jgi:glyoxylase-like metal-dependent hydrolase (beta-lactamase superfamily II)
MHEVAEGVYRLGRSHHNFYLITRGGKATVIDAGGSSELVLLERALHHLDLVLDDVEAILVTHAHTDHIGFAALASRQGISVRVHEEEAEYARDRSKGTQVTTWDLPLWRPPVWLFLVEMIRAGAHKGFTVPGIETVADGETLDLPGRPLVVHTPGHTAGHAAFVLPREGILFCGDAIATRSLIRGGVGPRMLEDLFHADPALARDSLGRLSTLDTELLLPGHGDPWGGPIADIVEPLRAG